MAGENDEKILKRELIKILAWLTAAAGGLLWVVTGHLQAHGLACAWVISLVLSIALYFVFSFLLDQYAKAKDDGEV